MKLKRMAFIGLFLLGTAWAQNNGGNDSRLTQVRIVPQQITDFERYALHADEPLVSLTFPAVRTEIGPNLLLSLTPRALAPFDAPNAIKVMAIEFRLSQSSPPGRGAPSHSVATLIDFDELAAFRSLFNKLAASGMPQSAFVETETTVRMMSKSGTILKLTAQAGGRELLLVSNDADSVTLSLDPDSARKWADAFIAAARTLDSARESAGLR